MYVRTVKVHIPGNKADWEQLPQQGRNVWQRAAAMSSGALTPGNALSIIGLGIVSWGAMRLYRGAWVTGLVLIIAGRLLDVADGYVADATKTKSLVGEAVDALCDKATIVIILTVTLATHTLNPVLLVIVFLHHLYTGVFGAIWGRRYQLHSSKVAKYAMFVSWVAIVAGIVGKHYSHTPLIYIPVDLLAIIYTCFAVAAIMSYHHELRHATLSVTKE